MAKSGMDYAKMQNLIKVLESKASQIDTFLRLELPGIVPKIADAYSGEAATNYKDMLTKTAEDMNTTLNELINNLKTTTEEMEAAYKAQEAKMAASVNPVQSSGGGNH